MLAALLYFSTSAGQKPIFEYLLRAIVVMFSRTKGSVNAPRKTSIDFSQILSDYYNHPQPDFRVWTLSLVIKNGPHIIHYSISRGLCGEGSLASALEGTRPPSTVGFVNTPRLTIPRALSDTTQKRKQDLAFRLSATRENNVVLPSCFPSSLTPQSTLAARQCPSQLPG